MSINAAKMETEVLTRNGSQKPDVERKSAIIREAKRSAGAAPEKWPKESIMRRQRGKQAMGSLDTVELSLRLGFR